MPLKEHLSAIEALIASTPFVTAISLAYEERPPSAGFITGTIRFIDDSQLDLKQFFIIQPGLQVIKYGYNYRLGDRLVFRYDNANDPAVKQLPTYPHHKHVATGLLATEQPSLEQVLQEIVSQINVS